MKKGMMKGVITGVVAFAIAIGVSTATFAMAPNLSITSNGNGTVGITVTADPNANVLLDYYAGGQLMGAGIIGTTNFSGYFSTTLTTYNFSMIPSGAQIIVMVNGQQSLPGTWPTTTYYNGGYPYQNTGTLTLSQNNLAMTVGQTQSIYINNGTYNSYGYNQYYINNTSSNIVNASVSGNTITLYAVNAGSTQLSVCASNSGYYNNSCTTLYLTVTGTYYYNPPYQYYPPTNSNTPISVSNNNVSLNVGGTAQVTLYGGDNGYNSYYPYNGYYGYGSNSYYITTPNSGIASASVSGNILTIYGSAAGNTSVTVCSANGGTGCATIYVNVAGSYYYNNGGYYNGQYQSSGNWYYSQVDHCWHQR